eukprot:CAMPEP_0174347052 /NCGR_PEP_ID=MMETSP0811_2-20130205/2988_1 /TAXON_ID=73025 ORGANISM="Eutreptiella gymnastica-like, Strain CCMP1594" /NCGR_SAMPLE_ID=MMETSP0811_2 /ASSEMBLY_ACC=CAM_ASM_000667 /LENGTH=53 /DNA_ID=CAMNT_0015472213 /DNA_START=1743 /DNA_END=1904 /DNA_ORIENTATION=+
MISRMVTDPQRHAVEECRRLAETQSPQPTHPSADPLEDLWKKNWKPHDGITRV